MGRKRYTESDHTQRLLEMLKRSDAESCCPGHLDYRFASRPHGKPDPQICLMCRSFIKVKSGCPCDVLGSKEAIKRTRQILREKN